MQPLAVPRDVREADVQQRLDEAESQTQQAAEGGSEWQGGRIERGERLVTKGRKARFGALLVPGATISIGNRGTLSSTSPGEELKGGPPTSADH